MALYQTLKDRGELSCRVFLNYSVDAQLPLDKIEARIKQAAANPLHQYDNCLWLRGIKCYLDGGMLTGSAYMQKPWGVSSIYSITDPDYRGLLYIQPDKLKAIARLALENDLQMTAHSVGDGAVQALVDAYAAIDPDLPVRERRPCITHCNFMSLAAIEKMQSLGIVADLQPAWLWLDGQTLLTQFGNDRLTYFQPYKTLFERGIVVGGGSDHMQKIGSLRSVNPYNPFLGMWTTLARRPRRADQPLHPEQRLTREQAIRLYTINNAFLTFEEKEKGSLERGKLADFVVLEQDILTCPEETVKDIEVAQTYLAGKLIYDSAMKVGKVSSLPRLAVRRSRSPPPSALNNHKQLRQSNFASHSTKVHLKFNLVDRRPAVMPVHAMNGRRADLSQDDFGQYPVDGMNRINVDGGHDGPVAAESTQSIGHQVHYEPGFCGQAGGRHISQRDDRLSRKSPFGKFAAPGNDERGRQRFVGRLRVRKAIENRFRRCGDDGSHIGARHGVDAVLEQAPAFENRRIFGIELGEARETVRPRRAKFDAAQRRLGTPAACQVFGDSLEAVAIGDRLLKRRMDDFKSWGRNDAAGIGRDAGKKLVTAGRMIDEGHGEL